MAGDGAGAGRSNVAESLTNTKKGIPAMFVHTVYFWLRRDLDDAQRLRFTQGLESLQSIPAAGGSYIGRPASTSRPVIDRTYDFSRTCLFKDQAEHDVYQVHPTHLAFVKNCSDLWIRVLVYDAE